MQFLKLGNAQRLQMLKLKFTVYKVLDNLFFNLYLFFCEFFSLIYQIFENKIILLYDIIYIMNIGDAKELLEDAKDSVFKERIQLA